MIIPPKLKPTFLNEFFSPTSRQIAAAQVVWFGLWVIVTTIGLWLRPDTHGHGTHQQLGLSPCPSVLFFSRPCPGCGLTTSWTAFLHGDFARSFTAHAIGPYMYVAFTVIAWASLIAFLKNYRIRGESVVLNRIIIASAVVFFSYGFVRMALVSNYAAPHERILQHLQFLKR
jgi:hypothetical protein